MTTAAQPLPVLRLPAGESGLPAPQGDFLTALAAALAQFLPRQRWFGGKSRTLARCQLVDWLPLDQVLAVAIVACDYAQGPSDRYVVPLASTRPTPEAAGIAWLAQDSGEFALLVDGFAEAACATNWLTWIGEQRSAQGRHGRLVGRLAAAALADPAGSDWLNAAGKCAPRMLAAEQSNSSVVFGQVCIFKLYRRAELGIHPDLEIVEFLTQRQFAHTPHLIGSLEYQESSGGHTTVGMLQRFVPNRGAGWDHVLEGFTALLRANRSCTHTSGGLGKSPTAGLLAANASLLGRRTAELHLALAGESPATEQSSLSGSAGAPLGPAFAPEPISSAWLGRFAAAVRQLARESLDLLAGRRAVLPPEYHGIVDRATAARETVDALTSGLGSRAMTGLRTRCHGDYHLGQVLWTGDDFAIIDFEGEPTRSLAERRAKHSPLKDVAGMFRSFDYAGYCAAAAAADRADIGADEAVRSRLVAELGCAFRDGYELVRRRGDLLPAAEADWQALLDLYLLEKACYELQYELNNRPAWAPIPLQAVAKLLGV